MKRALFFLLSLLSMGSLAQVEAANTGTITFTGTTQFTDGTTIPATATKTYDLYQGIKGGAKVRVGSFTSGGSITTGLLTGNEYCWDVVAIVNGVESAHSNEGCKKFIGVPNAVTITVT